MVICILRMQDGQALLPVPRTHACISISIKITKMDIGVRGSQLGWSSCFG